MSTDNPTEQVLRAFFEELSDSSDSILQIALNQADSLDPEVPNFRYITATEWTSEVDPESRFDHIILQSPLGMPTKQLKVGTKPLRIPGTWIEIVNALPWLKNNGKCYAFIEPTAFSIRNGEKFLEELASQGFHVLGLFDPPERITWPHTTVHPLLTVIGRSSARRAFVGELQTPHQSRALANSFNKDSPGSSLAHGLHWAVADFKGFDAVRAQLQIYALQTQYKEYDSKRLGDVAIEINSVRSGEKHKIRTNSVYIPSIGTSSVVSEIDQTSIKDHNLYQVVLDNTVLNEYLTAFFDSNLGRLLLSSLTQGSFIKRINKSTIETIEIAVPPLNEQAKIVDARRNIASLSKSVLRFSEELALNPKRASSIDDQIIRMRDQIGQLADEDKMRSLLRNGESKTLEFKQTFSVDIRKDKKERYIELSALKTIVAYLNSDGGILLVGVSDDGTIPGIGWEIEREYKTHDKFLLHVKNLIKDRIGEAYYPFINYRLVSVDDSEVLWFDCAPSEMPCYLDGKEFYVRTNPATDRLEGPSLVQYVNTRFGSNLS